VKGFWGGRGVAWYGMVWYGMVWYGMVWYGMVWYGMVWYGMVGVLGEFKVQEVKKSGRCVLEGEIDYKSWPWKKLWASCLL